MNTNFPDLNIPTTGYGGMGFTPTPQTYVQDAIPSWMQGGQMDLGGQGFQGMGGLGKGAPNWFQMPQWGTDVVTGEPLTQEVMQPQAPAPAPAPAPQQTPVEVRSDPRDPLRQMVERQLRAGMIDRGDARTMLGLSVREANRTGLPLTMGSYRKNQDMWQG